MSQYFPKPYEPFGGDIKVKVDLSSDSLVPSVPFRYKRKAKKRPWNFKHVIKICPNRWHIFSE